MAGEIGVVGVAAVLAELLLDSNACCIACRNISEVILGVGGAGMFLEEDAGGFDRAFANAAESWAIVMPEFGVPNRSPEFGVEGSDPWEVSMSSLSPLKPMFPSKDIEEEPAIGFVEVAGVFETSSWMAAATYCAASTRVGFDFAALKVGKNNLKFEICELIM